MNKEIKEYLDSANFKFKDVDEDGNEIELTLSEEIENLIDNNKRLADYITNLQQERDMYKTSFETMSQNYFEEQQENERLKARLTDTEWQYDNVRIKVEKQYIEGTTEELLEDIENCFFNGEEKPDIIPIDSLDICHIFGYIDKLKEDYNKAMELVDKGVENSYKMLKDYKSRCGKAIELLKTAGCYDEDMKRFCDDVWDELPDLLNILQNGSDSQ